MTEDKKQTIFAFVRLAVMLVAAGLAIFGVTVDANSLYTVVMCVVAVVAMIFSWWKNNNVTSAATSAQQVLDEMKRGLKPTDSVETLSESNEASNK